MGIHGAAHDRAADRSGLLLYKKQFHVLRLMQGMVAKRHRHDPVSIHRYRFLHDSLTLSFLLKIAFKQFRSLVMPVHVEYMIGRRQQHPAAFRQHNRLQYIYDLRNARHLHAVAVLIENIQRQPCHDGIPHRVLLVEKSRVRADFHIMPATPLVDDHADLLIRIILIHDRSVPSDQLFHAQGAL